ncbi:MAG: hypothetical protein NTV89_19370 [Proteobacteria bacterium]|nr:hypothetical protein [Pseudomonadota bacterium]
MGMLALLAGCATVRNDFAPLLFDAAVKTSNGILCTSGEPDRPYTEIGGVFVKGTLLHQF